MATVADCNFDRCPTAKKIQKRTRSTVATVTECLFFCFFCFGGGPTAKKVQKRTRGTVATVTECRLFCRLFCFGGVTNKIRRVEVGKAVPDKHFEVGLPLQNGTVKLNNIRKM